MWGPHQAVTVQATGTLYNARQFQQIVVAYKHGAPVYLRDVADVTDNVQNNRTAAWYNDERSVGLYVLRQPGTNTIAVTSAIHELLDQIKGEIPVDVTLRVTYDRAVSIGAGVHDVKFAFIVALVLVVLVIFVFLRNISATIIPSLALPMSIIGTFSVMYLLHYSIDNLSLMALTLAVGFVVDDAIVVLENIVRHMEMGKPRMQAALDGAAEVGSTIITMTTSLSAVFIPIMFMGGLIGMLFHEFGVTIAVAILVSGCVSLTLTPMLCSRFLSPVKDASHGRLYRWSEHAFDAALHAYERSLVWVMRHRPLMLGFSVLTLGVMVLLFITTPKSLFPSDDTGQIQVTTEGAEGHLLRGHPAVAAPHRQPADAGSERPVGHGVDRLAGIGQPGPHVCHAQAARQRSQRPASERRLDCERAHAQAQRRPGHRGVHPEPTGDPSRRP